jgi:hypothetical protein
VWWRDGDTLHGRDHPGGATVRSDVLDSEVALDELHLNAGT